MHRAPRKYDSIVVDYSAPHAHVRVSCDEGRERSGLAMFVEKDGHSYSEGRQSKCRMLQPQAEESPPSEICPYCTG